MCALGVLLLLIIGTVSIDGTVYEVTKPTEWWQTTTIYQIWPRSFKDDDGDGIGDLNGITSKLDHFVDMGIEVIWLSPFFVSPMVDSGYDIADFRNINEVFGTLDDFDALVAAATERGIKVFLDFVPNHTSDEHEWFIKSKASIEPYTDYYIWHEGVLDADGTRQPPNNWLGLFNDGSAWEWVDERQAYYLHQFHKRQVDLNFTNPLVIQETKDIITFWLDRGVFGFRVDAVPFLIEDSFSCMEPWSGREEYLETEYYYLSHICTRDMPGDYEIVEEWRRHMDDYAIEKNDGIARAMFTEAYANISSIVKYYGNGAQVPFNFFFMAAGLENNAIVLDTASDIVDVIDLWMGSMPVGATANWVFGNHDLSRTATRFGENRVDAINFLLYILPGVAITFNGDELGMPNTYLTWEQTEDPRACGTDETRYEAYTRDPMRTPYQWDDTTSAGFSVNSTTNLPVNENYITLNLAAQKEAEISHYKNVQAAIELRKSTVVQEGSLNVQVVDDQVIAFSRELDGKLPVAVLINWSTTDDITISLDGFENLPDTLEVLIADINSGIAAGDVYEKTSVELPANAAVVLRGIDG